MKYGAWKRKKLCYLTTVHANTSVPWTMTPYGLQQGHKKSLECTVSVVKATNSQRSPNTMHGAIP